MSPQKFAPPLACLLTLAGLTVACGNALQSSRSVEPSNASPGPTAPLSAVTAAPAPLKPSATPAPSLEEGWVAAPLPNDPNVVADSEGCVLKLRTSITYDDGVRAIETHAKNTTKQPLAITVDTQCHLGIVRLAGLPRDSFEQSCNKGACAPLPGYRVLSLAPGEEQVIGGSTVFHDGGTCSVAIKPGQHPITFTLPQLGSTYKFCGPKPAMLTVPPPSR